jgi:ATP-dependent RNA helicase DeaD
MVPDAVSGPGSADEPSPVEHDESDKRERSENELYVSVGRRDGAKPSDYHAGLEAAGITPESLEYVRVRHRHAFVGVRPDSLDRALSALNGATIAGRRANAERARRD